MWHRGDTIVLGVSGGADSMCLLHAFSVLADKEHLTLIVAHVNYGLRGKASQRDERHVTSWAKRLALPYHINHPPKHLRGTSENTWRKARYDFFARIAQKEHADAIAIAHNKNDQAETLLLNLLRGSGPDGLRGMPYNNHDTHVIRPLLDVAREDIVRYCKKNHIRYYNDKTNTDTRYKRNRIRHSLLPHLAKHYNPKIIDTLARTAHLLAQDNTPSPTDEHCFWHYNTAQTQATCAQQAFNNLSLAQQRRTLRTLTQTLAKQPQASSFGTIESFRRAIISTKNKPQFVHVPPLKCTVKGGIVTFTRHV